MRSESSRETVCEQTALFKRYFLLSDLVGGVKWCVRREWMSDITVSGWQAWEGPVCGGGGGWGTPTQPTLLDKNHQVETWTEVSVRSCDTWWNMMSSTVTLCGINTSLQVDISPHLVSQHASPPDIRFTALYANERVKNESVDRIPHRAPPKWIRSPSHMPTSYIWLPQVISAWCYWESDVKKVDIVMLDIKTWESWVVCAPAGTADSRKTEYSGWRWPRRLRCYRCSTWQYKWASI